MKAARHFALFCFQGLLLALCSAQTVQNPDVLWVARERADSINCLSRLKLIGFAARVWQNDNGGAFPPGFSVLTNELEAPFVLFCPSNYRREAPPTNWSGFDWNSIDYNWITPTNPSDPSAIFSRCKIHGHVGRVDGSADLIPGFVTGWPRMLAPPSGQLASTGSLVRFEFVLTNATAPFHIQWNREDPFWRTNPVFVVTNEAGGGSWRTNFIGTNTPIFGATNPVFVITNAMTNDAGYHSVTISNALGANKIGFARLYVPAPQTQTPLAEWLCLNRLRSIELAAALWANEHEGYFPLNLNQVTNEIGYPLFGWPALLYCPADTNRVAPATWSQVIFSDTSYEVLLTNSPTDLDRMPFARCQVHGFVVFTDGTIESALTIDPNSIKRTNGAISFTVQNPGSRHFEIQASTNLIQWTNFATATNGASSFSFTDPTTIGGRRFYRARQLP